MDADKEAKFHSLPSAWLPLLVAINAWVWAFFNFIFIARVILNASTCSRVQGSTCVWHSYCHVQHAFRECIANLLSIAHSLIRSATGAHIRLSAAMTVESGMLQMYWAQLTVPFKHANLAGNARF